MPMRMCMILRMPIKIPELLKKMMDVVPGKQAGLAQRLSVRGKGGLKVSQPQVSRWLSGIQDPERHNYDRIIEVAVEVGVLSDMRLPFRSPTATYRPE